MGKFKALANAFGEFVFPQAKSDGFSLVELLAITLMSAITAVVIVSVLSASNSSPATVICLNNLKQSGQASQFYANDYDGWVYTFQKEWWLTLAEGEYLEIPVSADVAFEDRNATWCPSLPPVSGRNRTDRRSQAYGTPFFFVHSDNPEYFDKKIKPCVHDYIRLGNLRSPSDFVYLADTMTKEFGDDGRQQRIWYWRRQEDRGLVHLRHDGKANIWFADGSARGGASLNSVENGQNPIERNLNEGWLHS